ncbi:Glycosyltransferase family 10 (fucosyltransferase) C-term [Butyrivibrio hungatei DSM 14810]|uniref:Glycosyltransferase family 10 (Fucosyltransferase) C-term n=1 Tax=Butyrivibrio hungatei DSM 14810 TaxID=1121132 RepID=A0A1M7T5A7_9FIRM|nr:glycosyltransferase family 10 [Butyrivibrio hungatei]SHN65848.1 Glycosyltransferase family 10 (fucosyltransferase) C-term [Butyrivibrio hungatei DSM 14810]
MSMKKIKIKFVGYDWPGFYPEELYFYRLFKKHYDVEISDNPDYVICSIFGTEYEYCKYPQIRIMCVGENYIPDFNLIDYSISRYPINYLDRNFYLIGCADVVDEKKWKQLETKNRNYPDQFINTKTRFANFIASHESENGLRGDFFKELCKYKRVDSVGSYLNNMAEEDKVTFRDDSKTNFQKKCKFTLCFESTSHEGFITEKISDAFYADTIPVYFGSTNVTEIFNEKAFIICRGREDFARTIDLIKKLDQDDDLYMEMLRQPIFVNSHYPSELEKSFEEYICHIFDQPIEHAYRRSRVYAPSRFEQYHLNCLDMVRKNASKKNILEREKALIKRVLSRLK